MTERRLRWGAGTAFFQEDEARRLLLAAVERCILRDGSPRIRIESVAKEAGVSRSTVYRYFPTRDDLIVGLLAQHSEVAVVEMIDALSDPADPDSSIVELITAALDYVVGDPVLRILYQPEEAGFAGSLTVVSNAVGAVTIEHVEPLLREWQRSGRLAADLDVTETLAWLLGVIVLLATSAITPADPVDRVRIIRRYVVQGLLPPN